tara:strand:+ start:908 stop:1402 length:495 start_codon:yes stop_codon:yes gene_type:complete
MTLNPGYTNSNSVEWYTPKSVFNELGVIFDLDPASSEKVNNVPAKKIYTFEDNGLKQKWSGFVWLNPPYSRNMDPWLKKFIQHGNGVMLLFSRTDTKWFHEIICKADAITFKKGRVAFELEGQEGRGKAIAPNMFIACGNKGVEAIKNIDGLYIDLRRINDRSS